MGLDWNPGPRARPGCEEEFRQLWKKLHARACFFRDRKVKRFKEITLTAYETLKAPRVGYDEAATRWAAQKLFPRRVDKSLDEETFLARMKGYYALDLARPSDGLPKYSNGSFGYVEHFSFRAQFLKDCEEIIGEELLNEAWGSKLPEDTIAYGKRLGDAVNKFADARGIDVSKIDDPEPESVEEQIDIVLSAARWCQFWGERGHWLEAYF